MFCSIFRGKLVQIVQLLFWMNFFYQIFRLSIFAPIQRHTDLNKSFQEKTFANITSFKILSLSNYYNTNLVLTKLFPFLHKFSRCTNIFHAPSRDKKTIRHKTNISEHHERNSPLLPKLLQEILPDSFFQIHTFSEIKTIDFTCSVFPHPL